MEEPRTKEEEGRKEVAGSGKQRGRGEFTMTYLSRRRHQGK